MISNHPFISVRSLLGFMLLLIISLVNANKPHMKIITSREETKMKVRYTYSRSEKESTHIFWAGHRLQSSIMDICKCDWDMPFDQHHPDCVGPHSRLALLEREHFQRLPESDLHPICGLEVLPVVIFRCYSLVQKSIEPNSLVSAPSQIPVILQTERVWTRHTGNYRVLLRQSIKWDGRYCSVSSLSWKEKLWIQNLTSAQCWLPEPKASPRPLAMAASQLLNREVEGNTRPTRQLWKDHAPHLRKYQGKLSEDASSAATFLTHSPYLTLFTGLLQ